MSNIQNDWNTFLGLLGIVGQPFTKQRLEKQVKEKEEEKARIAKEKEEEKAYNKVFEDADQLNARYDLLVDTDKRKTLDDEFERIHAQGYTQFNDDDFEEFSNNLGNIGKTDEKGKSLYKPMKQLIEEQRRKRNADAVRQIARGEDR